MKEEINTHITNLDQDFKVEKKAKQRLKKSIEANKKREYKGTISRGKFVLIPGCKIPTRVWIPNKDTYTKKAMQPYFDRVIKNNQNILK